MAGIESAADEGVRPTGALACLLFTEEFAGGLKCYVRHIENRDVVSWYTNCCGMSQYQEVNSHT